MFSTASDPSDSSDYGRLAAPPLPPIITTVFSSVKRNGRLTVPNHLQLKTAFGEVKLDLRDAIFPERELLLVAESLCASVEVLLPSGVSVVDEGMQFMSSHKVSQISEEHGPVIHVDGWSVCSDVKFISAEGNRELR